MNEPIQPTGRRHWFRRPSPRWLRRLAGAALAVSLLVFLCSSVFSVPQGRLALLTTFGRPNPAVVVEPGLHAKWPWQRIHIVDTGLQWLDLEPREKLTGRREPIAVAPMALWRVLPEQAVQFLWAGGHEEAERLLRALIWKEIDQELARTGLSDWLRPLPSEAALSGPVSRRLEEIRRRCSLRSRELLGVETTQVRIRGFTLPARERAVADRHMEARQRIDVERLRALRETRAAAIQTAARAEADRILSEAEAQVRRIAAEAQGRAETIEREAGVTSELRQLLSNLDEVGKLLDSSGLLIITEGSLLSGLMRDLTGEPPVSTQPGAADQAAVKPPAAAETGPSKTRQPATTSAPWMPECPGCLE